MLANNHKLILRNTGMLYIRMLLAMAVGLYTSRIILEVLGVENFGIYHVVAGFVALLGFMQGAMTTATQRYFAYDIGQNGGNDLCCLFNTSLQVHATLAFGIIALAETAGYWFVSTQLNILPDRLEAALLAYHFSVLTFAISVMTVPLTAMLMANERMGLFALISMLDVFLKLMVALVLPHLDYDKLSMYAALLFVVAIIVFISYMHLNKKIFPEVRIRLQWDPKSFRSMLSFTAWNTWGNLAAAMSEHGNNVLLNIFFGPAVNAARSIAVQAGGAINSFVSNVQAAVNPQIVKQYACGQRNQMHELVRRASKYNFFILITLAMPVLFYTRQILDIWLVRPPEYAAEFLRLTICVSLIDALSRPMMTSAQATGKVRLYQSVVGGILLINVPLALIMLSFWQHPTVVLWSSILLALLALVARLVILKYLTEMPIESYIKNVVLRVVGVGVVGLAVNYAFLPQYTSGWFLIAAVLVSMLSTVFVIYMLGLDCYEKNYLSSIRARLWERMFL